MSTYSGNRLQENVHSCGIMEIYKTTERLIGVANRNIKIEDIANLKLLINGQLVESQLGETYSLRNPTTEAILIHGVAKATTIDADAAIEAARCNFLSRQWIDTPDLEKVNMLQRLANAIIEKIDDLVVLEASDIGVPVVQGRYYDALEAVSIIRQYSSAFLQKIWQGESNFSNNHLSFSVRQPVGVVAAIVSWMSPLCTIAEVLCPALLCGNSVVLKISNSAPLVSLKFAEIFSQLKFPAGLVNVITGSGSLVGAHLSRHQHVQRVFFYGQKRSSKFILETCAFCRPMKKVNVQLVGKACCIVFPDSDLDKTADSIVDCAFKGTSGNQIKIDKIFVCENQYEAFINKLVERTALINIGDPLLSSTMVGPLSSWTEYHKAMSCIQSCVDEGARVVAGGGKGPSGYFVLPTIFCDVNENMKFCCEEELFGPIVIVFKYQSVEEAVFRSNNMNTSNFTVAFAKDSSASNSLLCNTTTNIVAINTTDLSQYRNIMGNETADFYSEKKTVLMNLG